MKKPRPDTTAQVDELLHRIGAESFAVPDDLVARTENRLAHELLRIRARRQRVALQLALAGVLSFPLVAGANGLLAWLLYSSLEHFVPAPLALTVTTLVGLFMLLSLSLSYGSLPILASIGLQFREETS